MIAYGIIELEKKLENLTFSLRGSPDPRLYIL